MARADSLPRASSSITDHSWNWPETEQWVRTLSLRDHNTRVVVLGTTMLGLAAGVIGAFAYLRKRAMLGDALSHATLPGIAFAFVIFHEKNLPVLLVGATVSGVLGMLTVTALRSIPRIKEDAAIGIVLSVYFGAGMVLLSLIQQMRTGEEAGLASFIYGKAAAMSESDARWIGGCAALVLLGSAALFKEFRMVCFDRTYGASQGWPVGMIDLLLMGLVVVTTVVGLQAVGLILVVGLLIIPSAAARFWTDRLALMTALSGVLGALSGWLGSTASALAPRLPTGAVIVMVAGCLFVVSMFLSPHRGILPELVRRWSLAKRERLQHLLRALAEAEERTGDEVWLPFDRALAARSWTSAVLGLICRHAFRKGLVTIGEAKSIRLTDWGRLEARRVLRNHRLWELYLIRYADIAPSHVDRDADDIEHVLTEPVVRDLERALSVEPQVPPSPHPAERPA